MPDWETDPRPFGECLKVWHKGRGREWGARELRAPEGTYHQWCSGRVPDREASLRRLMTLVDQIDGSK